MDDSPVLDVSPRAYPNTVHVATNQAVEPDAGFRSDHHVADNSGGWGDECIIRYGLGLRRPARTPFRMASFYQASSNSPEPTPA